MNKLQQKHYDELCQIAESRNYRVISPSYEGWDVKIQFQCPVGHLFEMQSPKFKAGQNCSKCMGVCPIQAKEELQSQVLQRGYELIDEYVNNKTSIRIKCNMGHILSMKPYNFKQGKGCRKCAGSCPVQAEERFRKFAMDRRYQIVGQYLNTQTKIELICPNHHTLWITPNNFVSKQNGCPKCANLCPVQGEENFRSKAAERHFKVTGFYVNTATKVDLICSAGHSFQLRPNCLISNGTGCPRCAGLCPIQAAKNLQQKTLEDKYILLDTYINNHTCVRMQCPQGHTFSITPKDYLVGHRCSTCVESYGEQLVRNALDHLKIPFSKNHRFGFLPTRKYDFAFTIAEKVIVIEWDGVQHFEFREKFHRDHNEFEEKQEIDVLKTQKAVDHGYKVIRIDYTWINKPVSEIAAFIHKCILDGSYCSLSNIGIYMWLITKVVIPSKIRLVVRNRHG